MRSTSIEADGHAPGAGGIAVDVLGLALALPEPARIELANRLVASIADAGSLRPLARLARNAGLIEASLRREAELPAWRQEGH